MARTRYTFEQIDFLKERRLLPLKELTNLFNARFETTKPVDCIQAVFKNRGIKRVRVSPGKGNGALLVYTPEKLAWLKENYPLMSVKELAAAFNAFFEAHHTVDAIKATLGRNGMVCGRSGLFESGNKPWNTGTKGQGLTGANTTSFKKGHVPANHKPLWSERVCSKDGYVYISIPEQNPYTGFSTRYKQKHVWLWEQVNGPTPKGSAIIFRDGDIRNFDQANLLCITRKELLVLNSHNYKTAPAELKPSILALARVEAEAGIRTRPGRGRKLRESV